MRKLFLAAAVSALSLGAFAQDSTWQEQNSMMNFNVDSIFQGTLNLDSSKVKGMDGDNDTQLQLSLNYFHALPNLRNLQVGGLVNYQKGTETGRGDFEDYGAAIGAYWNFQMSPEDTLNLRTAWYVGALLGYGWNNTYGTERSDDEFVTTTVAFGKRVPLNYWEIKQLVYTPEVAYVSVNSKTSGALEYSSSLQFRFLQFSVFF
jgi:hypothetical protein